MKLSVLACAISSCYAVNAISESSKLLNPAIPYGPRLNISSDYQNKSHSLLFFDGFLPFSGNNDHLWFADLRFFNREQGASEGNLGLAYRQKLNGRPLIAGAYLFIDRRRSFDKNFFSELTLGGELKAKDWSLGANVYAPVGQIVKTDINALNQTLRPTGVPGIYSIYYNQGREAALVGVDIEAGHSIPKIPGLTAYVGAYGYPSAHDVSTRVGPLVRAEYNLSDSGLLGGHPLMDSTVIEGFMRHDSFIGTSYYVGLKFGLNLDGAPRYKMDTLQRRMVDPIWRDNELITSTDRNNTSILARKANGNPLTVSIASNYEQLQTYVNQGIDVVGVSGTIDTSAGTIIMKNNQTLTGGTYEFQPQRYVQVGNHGALVSHANNQPILHITKNNTVEQLSFIMTGENPDRQDVNYAIANYNPGAPDSLNAIGVGHATIINNQFNNSGIFVSVQDGSIDSIFDIIGNRIRF